MPKVMADHNVEGHLQAFINIWLSSEWDSVWLELSCEIESFDRLGIPHDMADTLLWKLCQQNSIVLLTGNRNAESDDSLDAAIKKMSTSNCLPVITIGDPDRIMRDRDYAEYAASQMLQYLLDIELLRGTGRLYIP